MKLNEFEVKGESEAQVFSATFSSISVLFFTIFRKVWLSLPQDHIQFEDTKFLEFLANT